MFDVTDEDSALIQKILRQDAEELKQRMPIKEFDEWQTVKRKGRRTKPSPEPTVIPGESLPTDADVPIDLQFEERRRRTAEAQIAASGAVVYPGEGSMQNSEDGHSVEEEASAVENGVTPAKKTKKKPKKVKVTVAEAASKLDAGDLGAFLVDISETYQSQEDVQLMRFADQFGRAFASVSGAQFPWLKTLKESNVAKLVDIPLSHISSDVYKMSTDWIGKRSYDALVSFGELLLGSIITDLEIHVGASKGSKKNAAQQAPSKSQVSVFVVLAMVLRRKPDVLIGLVPALTRTSKHQVQEKLPLIVWLITQASVGDLTVGLYMWSRFLLPILGNKSACNPQSRDLILQLVERILSAPKARQILLNGASKKGERLVQPSSLDILMKVTFPGASDRVKATERFEAIYPLLKDVALAGSSGSKAMKQLAHQIFDFAIKAAKENVYELSKESSDVFFWCLKQNQECYDQWDSIYLENLKASVALLRRLSSERKEHHELNLLKDTFKSFKEKTKDELTKEHNKAYGALLKEADEYINLILGKSLRGHGCLKSVALVVLVVIAAGTATFISQAEQY